MAILHKRNEIRNSTALKILIKKIAESVRSEISCTRLHNSLKSTGVSISKDTVIDYVRYAQEAYLLFSLHNSVAKFSERESNPKYYFNDNGLLNLFLINKETSLLENAVAIFLHDLYGDGLYYLKSAKTGINIDFVIPDVHTAIQVYYLLNEESTEREIRSLIKAAETDQSMHRFIILTNQEKKLINESGVNIEVIPTFEYFLNSSAQTDRQTK